MLTELQPENFHHVLPMYREDGVVFPLISSVIQRKQRGQIFVDEPEVPASAVVITNFGFMSYLGAVDNEQFDAGLTYLLSGRGTRIPSYLLWYAPPAHWQARLEAFGSDAVRRRERVRFVFRPERATYLSEPAQFYDGFELTSLKADMIQQTEKFGLNLDSRFWSSANDFAENGLGVCLKKGNEVVSMCYAAALIDNLAEVDVVTEPEYRGHGLAKIVAKQFIRECVGRGVTPTWDCFVYNNSSVKLAETLAFIPVRNYPFYSFNTSITISEV